MMEVDTILAALAVGAAAGASDAASAAVKDAYGGLKKLIGRHLDGRLPEWEQAEGQVLRRQLAESGATSDRELLDAAAKLVRMTGGTVNVSAPVTTESFDRSLNAPVFNDRVVFDFRTVTESGQHNPPASPAAL